MDFPISAAIIGTGGIAKSHAAALMQERTRVDLVAAVDVDEIKLKTFCQEHNIPRHYTDVEEMLSKERPRLVHVCTPPGVHQELSVRCMEAGAWVLCEKPLCASLAELDAIEAAEARTGQYCSSVFQWRFGSGAKHLKQLLTEQVLGRPLVSLCQTVWYRDHDYYRVPWRGKWATELGGATMGQGIHALDLMLWLLGDWQEVRAMTGTLDRDIEVEDVSMALVKFENGAMSSVVNSVLSPRQDTYLRFDFQKATVEVRHLYSYTNEDWRYTFVGDEGVEDEGDHGAATQLHNIPETIPSSHASQLTALLDSMQRGQRPLVSGWEARRTIEFLASLYKSAVTGQPVQRGSIDKSNAFYHHMAGMTIKGAQADEND